MRYSDPARYPVRGRHIGRPTGSPKEGRLSPANVLRICGLTLRRPRRTADSAMRAPRARYLNEERPGSRKDARRPEPNARRVRRVREEASRERRASIWVRPALLN